MVGHGDGVGEGRLYRPQQPPNAQLDVKQFVECAGLYLLRPQQPAGIESVLEFPAGRQRARLCQKLQHSFGEVGPESQQRANHPAQCIFAVVTIESAKTR